MNESTTERPTPAALKELEAELAENARRVLRMLVQGPHDPAELARLDARAAQLRAAIRAAQAPRDDELVLRLGRGRNVPP